MSGRGYHYHRRRLRVRLCRIAIPHDEYLPIVAVGLQIGKETADCKGLIGREASA